ncbi:hypothetical protein SDC9_99021 [bioreactor metagenome]|uniref:N-acetyltransferase domain-containing protein n=1 Tax=bioreactor metagenome TaxID=1076179 RepID=A0A645ARN6_9ZZZZ
MDQYNIRKANVSDFPVILQMIKELADYELSLDKVINNVEIMQQEQELFGCFIAADSESLEVIGIALYFFAYYTWVGKSLYLEDLYVKPDHRNKGVGTSLLEHIFKLAKSEDCRRLRWQVLHWNESAINLYKKLGAKVDKEWYNCDFDYEQIKHS